MAVYVLIREDQNEYGYIDTTVEGVFATQHAAREREHSERERARREGLVVEDEYSDGDWQVSWNIEDHVLI